MNKYIPVDSETDQVGMKVKFSNPENEFKGKSIQVDSIKLNSENLNKKFLLASAFQNMLEIGTEQPYTIDAVVAKLNELIALLKTNGKKVDVSEIQQIDVGQESEYDGSEIAGSLNSLIEQIESQTDSEIGQVDDDTHDMSDIALRLNTIISELELDIEPLDEDNYTYADLAEKYNEIIDALNN